MMPAQASICILALEGAFCDMRDSLEPYLESELAPQATEMHLRRAKEHYERLRARTDELESLFENL